MINTKDTVVIVNEKNEWLGTMDKLEAHRKGVLHRALSVFLFNKKGELLLQKRAKDKYHSGGLWSNTCCSHPRPLESTKAAAHRRLKEEMGIETELEHIFNFRYECSVDNGLKENEYDLIFTGIFDEPFTPNDAEVSDYMFLSMNELKNRISKHPEAFSPWFVRLFPRICEYFARAA